MERIIMEKHSTFDEFIVDPIKALSFTDNNNKILHLNNHKGPD